MKRWFSVLSVLSVLSVSPVFAQDFGKLQADLNAARAGYGPTMTAGQVAQLLNAVAFKNPGFGLLRKDGGNSCPLSAVSIACDIMIYAPTIHHYDVLAFDDDHGVIIARLTGINDSGLCVLGPTSGCAMDHFLAPSDPGGSPPAPSPTPLPVPVPQPVPTLDLSGVFSRIDWSDANNERRYLDLKAEAQAAAKRDADLASKVQAIYDKPGLVEEILKSPYLYTVLGSILAGHYALPGK